MKKILSTTSRIKALFIVCVLLGSLLTSCSGSSEASYIPAVDESEFSESDVSACELYLGSTSLLERQEMQDFYETSVLIVRASYDARTNAWEQVFGSSNYEISSLTYADEWEISSAAQDLEDVYEEGLDVVGYTTDPYEIEGVLIAFFDAFDALNTVCEEATY